jgi:S1-C subfamily serine protease
MITIQLPGPDLTEVEQMFKTALAKVREQAVAVNLGGEASGALLSADGLVMTAGHVAMNMKDGDMADIELEDGRKFKAAPLGYDLEIDFALFKITDAPAGGLPHCEIADKAPLPGAYCFVLGHPSGKAKGRPAQPRLGRILNVQQRDGKPWIGMMDCEIQPGDSGCPVFDLNGKLIGVASSAAGHRRFNRFGVIDQLHANMEFLKTPGNKRGEFDKGPGGKAGYEHKFTDADIARLQELLQTRLRDQHQQTARFVRQRMTGEAAASINSSDLVNFHYLDGIAAAEGREISYGLDDPELLKPLVPVVKDAAARLPLKRDGKPAGFALRVRKDRMITADSLLGEGGELTVELPGKKIIPVQVIKRDDAADLAVLGIAADAESAILDPANGVASCTAGDLLVAVDAEGIMGIGNAMDVARAMGKPDSEGPIGEDMPLGKRRGNFPPVVAHSLPLYATDSGTPVFTIGGRFAGMHLERATRTYGVLVLPAQIEAALE